MKKTDAPVTREVGMPPDGVILPGTVTLSAGCTTVVALAHGSGGSRHSPRSRAVVEVLQRRGSGRYCSIC